jgi:hypothetical protein
VLAAQAGTWVYHSGEPAVVRNAAGAAKETENRARQPVLRGQGSLWPRWGNGGWREQRWRGKTAADSLETLARNNLKSSTTAIEVIDSVLGISAYGQGVESVVSKCALDCEAECERLRLLNRRAEGIGTSRKHIESMLPFQHCKDHEVESSADHCSRGSAVRVILKGS